MNNDYSIAVLGGGCFWCYEAIFTRLKGVISVMSGYAAGTTANPTYEQVCSGATGHAEVIKITFNPQEISYDDLLDVFFHVHDPTVKNRQGADEGSQYRSIILYATPAQKTSAEKIIQKFTEQHEFEKPIVTEIKPLEKFYEAEDYHQRYFELNREQPYCQYVISPKMLKFKEKYAKMMKN